MHPQKRLFSYTAGLSIRSKMILALCCISVLIAVYIGFVSYRLTNNKVMQMSIKLSENQTSSANKLLTDYLNNVHNWTTQILTNSSLRELSESSKLSDEDMSMAKRLISTFVRNQINAAVSNGIQIGYINFYSSNGFSYSSTSKYEHPYNDYDSCLKYLASRGLDNNDYSHESWIGLEPLLTDVGARTDGLVNIRFLYDSVTMKKRGVLITVIYEESLNSTYSGFANNAFIMDLTGRVLSSSSKSQIGSNYKDLSLRKLVLESNNTSTGYYKDSFGNTSLVSFRKTMNNSAFLVVPFDYYSDISQTEMADYLRSCALLIILGVAAAFILSILLSKQLYKSFLSLTTFVKHVNDENTDLRIQVTGGDEVAYLGKKINDMLDRLQSSARMRVDDLRARQLLELQLMQSQINPHLLYNTLNSVLFTLRSGNPSDATELVISLSEFFKHSLSRGKAEIPLIDELKLISHYIVIQKLARQKDITVFYEIDPEMNKYPIIKLTLQPLIENAILHGFAGYRDDGIIIIHAIHTDNTAIISVKDNGIGILPEEVEALNASLQIYPPQATMNSFGLYNINRRIVQTYGIGYGIKITSEVSDFTSVTLTMPYDPLKYKYTEDIQHV